jgi:uncharacterized SAM-binding protein YcdF (DUF218 family)
MVSSLISLALHPFFWVIGLLIASLILKSSRWSRRLVILAVILMAIFSNPFLHRLATNAWEPGPISLVELEAENPYDLAIVLGGFTRMYGKPLDRLHLNDSPNRFSQALELYYQGKVRTLVFVSGSTTAGSNPLSEAELARKAAIRLGVAPADTIALGESRNTFENAIEFREFLESQSGTQTQLLITSASHMRRAMACFSKQGLSPDTFPTDHRTSRGGDHRDTLASILGPNPATFTAWSRLFHEWLAMAAYRVRGRI